MCYAEILCASYWTKNSLQPSKCWIYSQVDCMNEMLWRTKFCEISEFGRFLLVLATLKNFLTFVLRMADARVPVMFQKPLGLEQTLSCWEECWLVMMSLEGRWLRRMAKRWSSSMAWPPRQPWRSTMPPQTLNTGREQGCYPTFQTDSFNIIF